MTRLSSPLAGFSMCSRGGHLTRGMALVRHHPLAASPGCQRRLSLPSPAFSLVEVDDLSLIGSSLNRLHAVLNRRLGRVRLACCDDLPVAALESEPVLAAHVLVDLEPSCPCRPPA